MGPIYYCVPSNEWPPACSRWSVIAGEWTDVGPESGPGPEPASPAAAPRGGFCVLYVYGLKRMVSRAMFRLACLNCLLTDGVYGSLRHTRL